MTTANDFVRQVLGHLPRGPMREQVAMELRGSIADRMEQGQSLDEVLKQLGDPRTLARSYLQAIPLVSASFARRVGAKLVDISIVVLSVLPILLVATRVLPEELSILVVVTSLVVGAIGFGVYTVGAEYWMGETLGKHFLGLRVVSESGERISLGQAIVRQLPMLFQFYWVDVLFALFTERNQRAFELLSRTRVVSFTDAGESVRS